MYRSILLFVVFTSTLPVSAVADVPRDASELANGYELPSGWTAESPRDEIRPEFSFEPMGGPKHSGSFVIRHDERDGLDGWFQKSFAVAGSEFYRFQVSRKLTNVAVPRRSALVRILWQDAAGTMVSADVPKEQVREIGHVSSAEPEHPVDGETDSQGWTTVHGVYRAPTQAARAVVELHLQWAPSELRGICTARRRGCQAESRSRRVGRNRAVRECEEEAARNCRSHSRAHDELFRPTRQNSRPPYRIESL
jgi:hypothetical protein